MKKKKTRVRKPKITTDVAHLTDWGVIVKEMHDLKSAKKLHRWLTSAIKYLESK